MSRGNEAAFPAELSDIGPQHGMSYRQYLIGQALAGICANSIFTETTVEIDAATAMELADAVIARLEEENNDKAHN
tara:strand:- start:3576 stop:3803 length:228 start_codon:yes stop_codon:yes gene_type:complete